MTPEFSALAAVALIQLHAKAQNLPVGAILLRQGDEIHDILFIENGFVKLTRLEEDGDETIVAWRKPGQILGAASLLSHSDALLTAATLTECELYRLPAQRFLQLVESNAGFARYLLQEISQQRNDYAIRQAQLATISARARLAQTMLEFMREEVEASATTIRVPFPFPDKDLASYLMVRPEYLSRMYRSLMDDGIIHRHAGASFVLDLNRLRKEANNSSRRGEFK